MPVLYRAKADEEVLFCGCKQTSTPPFCDGTHSNLAGGYTDEGDRGEDQAVALVSPDREGFARLDGDCYVVSPGKSLTDLSADSRISALVTPDLGSRHQSQFYLELDRGQSPMFGADGEVVIWVAKGEGRIIIGGERLALSQMSGAFVLADETFVLEGENLACYISVCPAADSLRIVQEQAAFHDVQPERMGLIDEGARTEMGPRYFQVLLDDTDGLTNSAQFIGHIPKSRAKMHRHLYEEALIIVSGHGMIWNQTRRAEVRAGDVIFFPRKHVHSLQSLSEDGMDVVGFIHPGTNPGINYY
ncbi:cupin domain-containing protein [Pacificimonas sp. ICDLI1SI03]